MDYFKDKIPAKLVIHFDSDGFYSKIDTCNCVNCRGTPHSFVVFVKRDNIGYKKRLEPNELAQLFENLCEYMEKCDIPLSKYGIVKKSEDNDFYV